MRAGISRRCFLNGAAAGLATLVPPRLAQAQSAPTQPPPKQGAVDE